MQEHPWHHFWTRSVDAATGVDGSAESMAALPVRWWQQSVESSQVWTRWWLDGWLSAGWPSHGAAYSTLPPWPAQSADAPLPHEQEDDEAPADAEGAGPSDQPDALH